MGTLINIKGQRFGKLVPVELAKSKNGAYWLCDCDCGTKPIVRATSLRNGNTKSCGCNIVIAATGSKHNLTHGGSKSRSYVVWNAMKTRCYNKKRNNYHNYGGRGITVCDRWLNSFENFLEDMGERPAGHSLDRRDSNGNYCKENCRWATSKQQGENRRGLVIVDINGEKLNLSDAVKKYSTMAYPVVCNRIYNGWDIIWAITAPSKSRRKDNDRTN